MTIDIPTLVVGTWCLLASLVGILAGAGVIPTELVGTAFATALTAAGTTGLAASLRARSRLNK